MDSERPFDASKSFSFVERPNAADSQGVGSKENKPEAKSKLSGTGRKFTVVNPFGKDASKMRKITAVAGIALAALGAVSMAVGATSVFGAALIAPGAAMVATGLVVFGASFVMIDKSIEKTQKDLEAKQNSLENEVKELQANPDLKKMKQLLKQIEKKIDPQLAKLDDRIDSIKLPKMTTQADLDEQEALDKAQEKLRSGFTKIKEELDNEIAKLEAELSNSPEAILKQQLSQIESSIEAIEKKAANIDSKVKKSNSSFQQEVAAVRSELLKALPLGGDTAQLPSSLKAKAEELLNKVDYLAKKGLEIDVAYQLNDLTEKVIDLEKVLYSYAKETDPAKGKKLAKEIERKLRLASSQRNVIVEGGDVSDLLINKFKNEINYIRTTLQNVSRFSSIIQKQQKLAEDTTHLGKLIEKGPVDEKLVASWHALGDRAFDLNIEIRRLEGKAVFRSAIGNKIKRNQDEINTFFIETERLVKEYRPISEEIRSLEKNIEDYEKALKLFKNEGEINSDKRKDIEEVKISIENDINHLRRKFKELYSKEDLSEKEDVKLHALELNLNQLEKHFQSLS